MNNINNLLTNNNQMKIRLCNYFDVWGNQKEGYEINNWCYEDSEDGQKIHTLVDTSDKGILRYLKKLGFLRKHCRLNMFDIDYCYAEMEIWKERKTGMPIFSIEYVDLQDELTIDDQEA